MTPVEIHTVSMSKNDEYSNTYNITIRGIGHGSWVTTNDGAVTTVTNTAILVRNKMVTDFGKEETRRPPIASAML